MLTRAIATTRTFDHARPDRSDDGVPLLFRGLAFATMGSMVPWLFIAWYVL